MFDLEREGFADCIKTRVDIRLGFADRIRALIGLPTHVFITTWTENLPGKVTSESRAWVERLDLLRRLGLASRVEGLAETPKEDR